MDNIQTANGHGLCVFQCHSKQRTTCYISKLLFSHQKLYKSKKMVIGLYFINKYKRIFLISHSVSGDDTQCHIKILGSLGICKNPVAQLILLHIYFNIVRELSLANPTDDIRFTYLPSSINEQHSVRTRRKILLNSPGYLSVQHNHIIFKHKYSAFSIKRCVFL